VRPLRAAQRQCLTPGLHAVLDHLLAAGQLCRINAVYGERFSEAWLQKATAALRVAGCKTKIIVLQGRDGVRQPAR